MLRPSFLLPALTLEGPLSPAGKALWYPPGRTCRGCKLGGAHPLVSAAASGAGRQWRPFSADRSGNVDRFAAERHRRSLTPSHAPTVQRKIAYRHGRGMLIYNLIPKGGDGCLPPLITPRHIVFTSRAAVCYGDRRAALSVTTTS